MQDAANDSIELPRLRRISSSSSPSSPTRVNSRAAKADALANDGFESPTQVDASVGAAELLAVMEREIVTKALHLLMRLYRPKSSDEDMHSCLLVSAQLRLHM